LIAVVGLGANLGDRHATLVAAVAKLRAIPYVASVTVSAVYETDPVGGPAGQPPYLNAAARLELPYVIPPLPFVSLLLEIERSFGRVRDVRHGPRTIDLDLLWTDQGPSWETAAMVPHPRLHERAFALAPLVEVAPEAKDPDGVPYVEILAKLDRSGIRRLDG
jgi:2-amino-4-hydroxy-6-hydroxymethyldihydropteridine diphosphokinase